MPGTLIRKIRENKKMSQDEVARGMGISQNAYSKIENNQTQLTVNHIKKLSKILDVSMVELLKDDFEIHKPLSIQAESVSKEVLMMTLSNLKDRLHAKQNEKNEFYPILMYQLQAAENILSHID